MPSRSRFRPQPVRRVVLQPRDLAILAAVFLGKCLTVSMICEAFFTKDGMSRCRRRLRLLYDWGFLDRQFLPTAPYGSEAVYVLGKAGLPAVLAWCADHGLEVTPDDARTHARMPVLSLLNHSLQVARLYLACRAFLGDGSPVCMDTWMIEILVRAQFDVRTTPSSNRSAAWKTVVFKPDAAIRLSGALGSIRTVFMEGDCATETSKQLSVKFETHRLFLASGQFADLYGEPGFLTVVATTGTMEGRVANIAAIAARVGAHFVLATTIDAFATQGPLACPFVLPSGERTTLQAVLDRDAMKGDTK